MAASKKKKLNLGFFEEIIGFKDRDESQKKTDFFDEFRKSKNSNSFDESNI